MDFTKLENGKTLVSGHCAITGEAISFEVDTTEFDLWQQGMPLQNAMPELAPEKREFLLSGIGPNGFAQLFTDDEPVMVEDWAEVSA